MTFIWYLSLPGYALIEKCKNNIRLTAVLPTQRNFGVKNASNLEGIMPTRSTFEEINLKRPASAIRQVRVLCFTLPVLPFLSQTFRGHP